MGGMNGGIKMNGPLPPGVGDPVYSGGGSPAGTSNPQGLAGLLMNQMNQRFGAPMGNPLQNYMFNMPRPMGQPYGSFAMPQQVNMAELMKPIAGSGSASSAGQLTADILRQKINDIGIDWNSVY